MHSSIYGCYACVNQHNTFRAEIDPAELHTRDTSGARPTDMDTWTHHGAIAPWSDQWWITQYGFCDSPLTHRTIVISDINPISASFSQKSCAISNFLELNCVISTNQGKSPGHFVVLFFRCHRCPFPLVDSPQMETPPKSWRFWRKYAMSIR